MKVFLSWSGEKSKSAAEAMRDWLPYVMNAVEPWMSSEDIAAGARWGNEIQQGLEETNFGILFVTRENLNAPWLLFEAGALAKTLADTFVCPYLLDMKPTDVPSGPLTQFQAKEADRGSTLELLRSINNALKDQTIAEERVATAFDKWWPDLESKLNDLPQDEFYLRKSRPIEEVLEEVLAIVRRLDRSAGDQMWLRNAIHHSHRYAGLSELAELIYHLKSQACDELIPHPYKGSVQSHLDSILRILMDGSKQAGDSESSPEGGE